MIPAAATVDLDKDVMLDDSLVTMLLEELDALSAEGNPSELGIEANKLLREVLTRRKKTPLGI